MLFASMMALYALIAAGCLGYCLRQLCRLQRHALAARRAFAALFAAAALLPPAGAFARPARLAAVLRRAGNLWLGTALYLLLGAVCLQLAALGWRRLQHRPRPEKAGLPWRRIAALTAAAVLLVAYGTWHAGQIRTVRYTVPEAEAGTTQTLRIAFVADLHMGCQIGGAQIGQMVDKINRMDPDLVLIGGDIFDSDYDMLQDPDALARTLRGIRSRYGVYGVYGNHDVTETLIGGFAVSPRADAYRDPRMAALLQQSGVTMLEDEAVSVAGGRVWLVGRRDGEKAGAGLQERLPAARLLAGAPAQATVIVLEHEPTELRTLAGLGADLVLSGHTHAGQFFPLTLAQPLIWENAYGMRKIGSMYSIVTAGVGVYGPPMRVLTDSEVVQIDLCA